MGKREKIKFTSNSVNETFWNGTHSAVTDVLGELQKYPTEAGKYRCHVKL